METEQKGGPSVNMIHKKDKEKNTKKSSLSLTLGLLSSSKPPSPPLHGLTTKVHARSQGCLSAFGLMLVSTAGSSLEHQHNNGLTFRFSMKANVNHITKEDIWYPVSGSRIPLHNEFKSSTVIRTWHLERQKSARRQGCLNALHSTRTC